MKFHRIYCVVINIILTFLVSQARSLNDTLDISGSWSYRLSGAPSAIPGEGKIIFPNTLDNAHKSIYHPQGDNTSQLRREFSFVGEASYSKHIRIPENWNHRDIELFLERTKPSEIRIDGKIVGRNSRISSPQRYDLTDYLSPGNHTIEIRVNNSDSIPPIIARSSSAVSEATQTNWNGILGDMWLIARDPMHIESIRYDDKNIDKALTFEVKFSETAPQDLVFTIESESRNPVSRNVHKGIGTIEIKYPIEESDLWSATYPNLHELIFTLSDKRGELIDTYKLTTGFRDFSTSGRYFTVNGQPVFLRGTVNAAIFPKTTYAPTDLTSWEEYFEILKQYGINHVRFHSWTPSEAAFTAADKAGMYLMVELPIWGELDRDLQNHNRFLQEDMKGIMESYSHHPSFVMFSPGNELWGDISLMGEYMKRAKELNPRILSTYGTNVYLGMNGQIGEEDFIVSSKTDDEVENSIRGSVSFADSSTGGYFNSTTPNSIFNFGKATENITVPLVSHEVGQYQSYPDFEEIEKYTGNLLPDNLIEFKNRAMEAGTLRKNKAYHEASGKWAAKLYKAEMEMAMRSPGLSGFELFGLQDYPGQGTALIGILDPFLDSKGFITPELWRESSSDLAILAEFPKFTFLSGENVEIPVVTVNFTDNDEALRIINWETEFSKGSFKATPGIGVIENDFIHLKMPKLSAPKKMKLSLSTSDGGTSNTYYFWVYPKEKSKIKGVTVTDNLTEALIMLDQGERVLLCPDTATIKDASLEPLFTTDFWNYRMFRTICDEMGLKESPGTLGLLINQNHPALKKFPTENHTDWQWYSIVANSRPLIIDRLPKDFDPVVEVIDNVERNFRLALMLECNVGKGKLMILAANKSELEETPEGEWLLQSLKEYMDSKEFKPAVTLTPEQLVNLLTKPSTARLIKELKNETYNSKWE